jgi:hypothetical protein
MAANTRLMTVVRNIRFGRSDVDPTAPAHTPGVREGNTPGSYEKMDGHLRDGRSTSRRSTGINPDKHNPIDRRMPNLSPA